MQPCGSLIGGRNFDRCNVLEAEALADGNRSARRLVKAGVEKAQ
jgi:hypothetical protein